MVWYVRKPIVFVIYASVQEIFESTKGDIHLSTISIITLFAMYL